MKCKLKDKENYARERSTNIKAELPALFSRFRAREREAKKRSTKARRKKSAKKAKVPSAKEKKREFALFPQPSVKIRIQSPKPLGRGKSKGLE
jgi:hypothetical protein